MTTKKFLEVFGLASLRDLPDIERLEDAEMLTWPSSAGELDGVLGLTNLAQRALVDEAVRATKATRRAQSRRPRQTEQSIEAPPPPAPDPPRALPYFPVEEWDD